MEFVLLCNFCRQRVFVRGADNEVLVRFCEKHRSCDTEITDHESHPRGLSEWDGHWGKLNDEGFDLWLTHNF